MIAGDMKEMEQCCYGQFNSSFSSELTRFVMGQCLLNPLARRVHRSAPDSLYHSSPQRSFFQSVLKSHSLPSLVPLSFPRLQSDNFPQQKFFSHILHNSRLSLSRNLSLKYSIVPTVFQLSHKYGKAALNSNNDKTRQHS